MKQANFELPDETHRALKVSAACSGSTMNSIVVEAIEQWLERNAAPISGIIQLGEK